MRWVRYRCGCGCSFDSAGVWGLGLKSRNQAIVARFWGAPLETAAGTDGGCWLGVVYEVVVVVCAAV